MLRSTALRRGSYLLFPYLESDWRQSMLRDENSKRCVERFSQLQATVGGAATAAGSQQQQQQKPAAPPAIIPAVAPPPGTLTADEIEAQELRSKLLHQSSDERINHMLYTFSKNGMTDDLNSVLRFVKSARGTALTAYHLNFLMRCLAASREKQACVNLLHLMVEKEEVDVESVAIAVGALHSWNGRNRFSSIASLMRNVHCPRVDGAAPSSSSPLESPLPLTQPWVVRTAYELSLFPLPKRVSLPHSPRQTPEFASAPADAHVFVRTSHLQAPSVSSLLAAVATGPEGVVAALVAAVWIRAAGAELSAFDFFHILSALARDADHFDEVRRVFCSERNAPPGYVTLAGVVARIAEHPDVVAGAADPRHSIPRDVRAAHEVACLARDSIERHCPAAATAPIHIGFLNRGAASAEDLVRHVFDEVHRRPTVGWAGESAVNIHHAYALMLTALRRDSLAGRELENFLRRLDERSVRLSAAAPGEQQTTPAAAAATATATATAPPPSTPRPRRRSLFATPFGGDATAAAATSGGKPAAAAAAPSAPLAMSTAVAPPMFPGDDTAPRPRLNMWFPKDVGFRFPLMPRAVLEEIRPAYERMCALASDQGDDVDTWTCWALGLPMLRRQEEVAKAVDRVVGALRDMEIEKSVRQMIRSLLQLFATLPLPRPATMTPSVLAERKKWGLYFESRDAALALFGQTKAGRDAMRRIFSDDGRLLPMRSRDVIASDVADVAEVFSIDVATGSRRLSTTTVLGKLPQVPDHLSSPSNPFPLTKLAPGGGGGGGGATAKGNDGSAGGEDLFMRLHRVLHTQQDQWWFAETDTAGNYLRCLLHRLDWQAAGDIATQITVKRGFQAALDSELQRIFEEIGDPAGAMCFKFATKFIDGRIIEESASHVPKRRPSIFGAELSHGEVKHAQN